MPEKTQIRIHNSSGLSGALYKNGQPVIVINVHGNKNRKVLNSVLVMNNLIFQRKNLDLVSIHQDVPVPNTKVYRIFSKTSHLKNQK